MPSNTSALYMITQLAPITIISPARMKIEKSVFVCPRSQRVTGRTNQRTKASPAAVRAARPGTPAPRASGTRLRIMTETPRLNGTSAFELEPENVTWRNACTSTLPVS
jgi:hypothetical protein